MTHSRRELLFEYFKNIRGRRAGSPRPWPSSRLVRGSKCSALRAPDSDSVSSADQAVVSRLASKFGGTLPFWIGRLPPRVNRGGPLPVVGQRRFIRGPLWPGRSKCSSCRLG